MFQRIKNQEWFQGLLDFVFPPLCLGCSAYHEDQNQICQSCLAAIEVFENPLCLSCQAFVPKGVVCPICLDKSAILFAYANYQPPLKEIIHQFKFRGITSPARTFAPLIFEKFKERLSHLDAQSLVPIPLYSSRENRRGYNQAELIARELSVLMNLPVNTEILWRTKRGREQARLPFKKRLANISGAFSADVAKDTISTVILVDDVVTSGATVMEASRCLETAGCNVTGIISIAHGI